MSGYRLPAAAGAWIDRSKVLSFRFDGRSFQGHAGDTLASALLASGVVHTGRSFKLHRPRGIFSCGVEEPTGLLDIGDGARRTPNTRATDIALRQGLVARPGNAWPSLRLDIGSLATAFAALLPAGFYYKTFMWPGWRWFEPAIRRAAGLGHAAAPDTGADPDRYDEVSVQVHTLVVGGGVAGLEAAVRAARAGSEVLLMEGQPRLGGWMAAQGETGRARVAALADEAARLGVRVITGCTVFGLYDHQLAAGVQTVGEGYGSNASGSLAIGGVRERLWKLRAQHIVIACGAFERPMLFPDNDRPGVMLASAVQRHAELYGVACGRRVLVAAACDSAYGVAHALRAGGIEVAAIVDHRATPAVEAPAGVPVHRASAIVAVQGARAVKGVTVMPHDGLTRHEIDTDCIAVAGGWTPAVSLYSMAGGKLRWDERASMFVPALDLPGISVVGACAGQLHAGEVPAEHLPSAAALAALGRRPGKVFVDLQNDVTASDIALAARENYRSVEHLKRYTTTGMATDQGKTSNVNALVLMGTHTQRTPPQVGTTKFRPPFKPVTLNAIAAGRSGERIRPLKRMPGHAWHAARQGLFEEFGGWLRPAAYLQPGENLEQAAQREALQVRRTVGLFEGSPLGKIEVFGPDAADFLDLMYVGTMSTLPVGGARYGVLLNENGVIVDDGIVARLAEHHFWVNTTSGGAERIALAFEEWLQCEYVNHRVLVTNVTSSWGNVTVSGPRAWALLEAAGFDAALAPAAMKHMTLRETTVDGQRLRVLRASFNGELGYEINLPALQTQALLDRLWNLGQGLDVVPYGIEALMVMRTEKGYLHVGGDTDGTTLPGDVGMDRGIARKAANFVGRSSLLRPAALDPDRLQLIGLVPVDRRTLLPVGAHAVAPPGPPGPIEGFVTSSHHSPNLGHPVALAMLKRGRARLGERITVHHLGTAMAAEVVATSFFDPTGERLHGCT